jgi:N-acetylglutamate synthase-like GNAT family acetyltransferase
MENHALGDGLHIAPRHDLTPAEIGAVEERLYDFNRGVTGRHDGEGLAFVIRDASDRIIGAAAGYSWAGIAELRQMWIAESLRGRGHARTLIGAFIDEAKGRGAKRIWVASYDFQAPGLYEKMGFTRMAELEGWPEGHTNVFLCKVLE